MPVKLNNGLGEFYYIQATGDGKQDNPVNLGFATIPSIILCKAGTVATSGDNTLITAPGTGLRIVLVSWSWWNESSTDTTAILKSTSLGSIDRYVQTAKGSGKIVDLGDSYVVKLAENEALLLNLSGANSHGYSVRYFIEEI